MAKPSQLDKAIASIDADIAVLQAARARLIAQQTKPNPPKRVKLAAVGGAKEPAHD